MLMAFAALVAVLDNTTAPNGCHQVADTSNGVREWFALKKGSGFRTSLVRLLVCLGVVLPMAGLLYLAGTSAGSAVLQDKGKVRHS